MSKLLIIENVTPEIIRFVKREPLDSHLLLLSPEAAMVFQDAPLKIHFPEDFVKAEQLNQLGRYNFQQVRNLVSIVDEEIWRNYPVIRDHNLRFAFYHFDRFKIIMDSITSRILILDEVTKNLKPTQIYHAKNNGEDIDFTLLFKESIYDKLMPFISERFNIPVTTFPYFTEKYCNNNPYYNNYSIKIKKYFGKLYRNMQWMLKTLKQSKHFLSKKKLKILAINPSYDLAIILNSVEVCRKYEIFIWNAYNNSNLLNHLFFMYYKNKLKQKIFDYNFTKSHIEIKWDDTGLQKLLKKIELNCQYRYINWLPLIEKRLKYFMNIMVQNNYTLYLKTLSIVRKLSPDIVLSNTGVNSIEEGVVIKGVKDFGIPFTMVQHGGGGYGLLDVPNVLIRDFEQVPDSYYITWGEGVKDYFYESSKKYNVNILPLGSSTIRKIHKTGNELHANNKSNTVYYICNNFRGNMNYYPGGQHYTDTWYFNFHIKVIEIFKRHKSYKFIFKVPPSFRKHDLYNRLFKYSQNIELKDEKLINIIHNPTLYIIDSLSTAIIQAAATRIPIIVYVGEHCKIANRKALSSLRKRALCCETEVDFYETIDTILKDLSEYNADPYNMEFINLYGISGSEKEPHWDRVIEDIVQSRSQ